MNKQLFFRLTFFSLILVTLAGCGNKKELIVIETPYGEMKAVLYDETPIHKKNFLKLAKSGAYDSVLFHRVIEDFMIQTGDLSTGSSKEDIDYTLEAEFMDDRYFHEKGALAAARMGDQYNPEKKSSGSQFYVVQGQTYDDEGLAARGEHREYLKLYGLFQKLLKSKRAPELIEKWNHHLSLYEADTAYDIAAAQRRAVFNAKSTIEKYFGPQVDPGYSDEQRATYARIGGTPHLDAEYTVFGKVVEGLDIIDKIAALATDERDRPLNEVRMKVRVESVSEEEYNRLTGNKGGQ